MPQTGTPEILADLNEQLLQSIVSHMPNRAGAEAAAWTVTPLGQDAGNFVTGGVFRLAGKPADSDTTPLPWSLIIKLIVADASRNEPSHYNHWRREALAYRSCLLDRLPGGLNTPACYAIEEKPDGMIWLWLEDVEKHAVADWQEEHYAYAARRLGEFNGACLAEGPPQGEEWLNRAWLRSWVHECRSYEPWPPLGVIGNPLADDRLEPIVRRFDRLQRDYDGLIDAVEHLPRLVAHQDYYRNNLLIHTSPSGEASLTLIDWQFASLSGIGEDLGRFFGLAMSRSPLPTGQFAAMRDLLWNQYLSGLQRAGWEGDVRLARYGFTASCAVRSVWEVPKLLRWHLKRADTADPAETEAKIERLSAATTVQLDLAEEALMLRGSLWL